MYTTRLGRVFPSLKVSQPRSDDRMCKKSSLLYTSLERQVGVQKNTLLTHAGHLGERCYSLYTLLLSAKQPPAGPLVPFGVAVTSVFFFPTIPPLNKRYAVLVSRSVITLRDPSAIA